ncbi:MAG: cytochrome c biogenesis protein CcdA [Candidatus Hatepunaea meridiana]|nr:cytochrome c biogenesis protein CcdA [Candidatus Hatepunaea meridiana]
MRKYLFQRGLVIIGLALLYVSTLPAQIDFDPEADVALRTIVEPETLSIGIEGKLTIEIGLPEAVHITSQDMGFFFVQPDTINGVLWGNPVFPPGVEYEGDTVYRGLIEINLPVTISGDFKPNEQIELKGTVGYQICSEAEPIFCTPPVERNYSAMLIVGDSSDESRLTIEERVKRALERGSFLALIWIFVGGVLLSFTPCVYPVIPITIAFIGAHSGGSRLKGLSLSLVFVLGLALVYSILGVIAAASGGVFGLSTQNPWVIGFVTVVFLVMGAGMMGAFELSLPAGFQSKLASGKRTGYIGALLVGGTTGLVAAPCVGPVLVALLSWVSSSGNLFLGFLYLFVFACGLGLLFIVIGTFAGAVTALPKAGGWMEKVKYVFGIILIAAAFYFGKSLITDNVFTLLVGLGLLMLAGFFGAFSRLDSGADLGAKVGRGIAFFVLIIGGFYVLLGIARMEGIKLSGGAGSSVAGTLNPPKTASIKGEYKVNWMWDDEVKAFNMSNETGKVVMIDFWADWCAACKELDHQTFSAPEVYNIINNSFIPLKIDGSKITDDIKAIWARYNVKGLPTVLFISSDGEELARFEAFRTVEQVMPLLERLK